MGVNSCGTTLIDNGTFQNIGSVTWDTTAKTSGFTGVAGNGYFVNTTSGAITVTLPASPSAGDAIGIKDYANTADTNNITIARNGSNINGDAADYIMNIEGLSVILVYVDGTKGWLLTNASQASDLTNPFISATGGTITTSGDFKIHTFTSPGTFCVSGAGSPAGSTTVDYMVVAGGAGGGGDAGCASGSGSGGGAGGFRESHSTPVSGCYTASPLATPTGIPVSVQGYPITVGAGGAGGTACGNGGSGGNSIFSTITSAGGGGGTRFNRSATAGGSGGGATMNNGSGSTTGASGNNPPVSPPQGNKGGNSGSFPNRGAAGGGGATAAGSNNPSGNDGTAGGAGATTNITASPVAYSGGGGAGGWNGTAAGSGGSGGGGAGGVTAPGSDGTANTGGAGGGGGPTNAGGVPPRPGGAGGSGIVVIRYKYQ